MTQHRIRFSFLACAIAAGIAGCDSIGEGVALQTVELRFNGVALEEGASAEMFECLPASAQTVAHFSDGTAGDFSSRATYTSDNPDVVEVSNGDVEAPTDEGEEQLFFVKGALVPRAPGTANIRVEYLGLTALMPVEVNDLGEISITPDDGSVVPGTTVRLTAIAQLGDDRERDVTTSGEWSFVEPDEEVATIVEAGLSAGVVSGVAASEEPLVAQFELPVCEFALTTPVTVENAESITLEKEFDGDNGLPPTTDLVIQTTERYFTFANFASGHARQDITFAVTYQTSDDEIADFGASLGRTNILGALEEGTVTVFARFGIEDEDEETPEPIDSNEFEITSVDATLESFTITPLDPEVPVGCPVQFRAIGSFDGGTRLQETTRSVGWVTDDFTVALIGNGASDSGLAVVTGEGEATVTGTDDDATVDEEEETTITGLPAGSCDDDDDDDGADEDDGEGAAAGERAGGQG